MQAQFVSCYEKKLKYKIYDVNGERRKLIKKGSFTGETSTQFTPNGNEVIVRVSKANTIFIAFFIWIYNCISDFEFFSVNWFSEMRVTNVHFADVLTVVYRDTDDLIGNIVTPVGNFFPEKKTKFSNVLFSSSHPNVELTDRNKAVNKAFIALSVMGITAVICLVLYFTVRGVL